ncbi:MAG: ATP-binding cassette domain-containing protein [Alphaproteobacteria bacterium]|nr:ATP-binding cassette domain-containing protein [Alphaproteobacteria bacterium]
MSGLRLENITKSFGAIQVLQPMTLAFKAGQVTAIVGDNGAGKSTLLKVMAGIHKPNAGAIYLDDKLLTNLSAADHRACGVEMVYQDLALAKQQNVVANLFLGREQTRTCFGFLNRTAMAERAKNELNRLGISIADLNTPVGMLSGGQQQAVAIARAALFEPKVLLFDEPTAALAAREVGQVLDLIRQQKEQGRIVILVSHRLNDVFAVADRIVVMKQGRLISDTPTAATSMSKVVENIVG